MEQRAYIKIRALLGYTTNSICQDLVQVYSMKDTLSYPAVRRWAQRFKAGWESVEDDPRSGAPVTAATTDNKSAIKKLIDLDPHVTIKELANTLKIAMGTVDGILKSQLNLSKVCARWVPHSLTAAQKVQRVKCCKKLLNMCAGRDHRRLFEIITGDETWVRYDTPLSKESNKVWKESQSDPPMIAKPDFRTAKIMYSIFFDGRGPVAQILVPKGRTVTGNFYTNSCLLEVEHHLTRRRPKTGAKDLRLLHDNARPCTKQAGPRENHKHGYD